MEETTQEVNSESSENSVDSVTQSEGNLSMAELASSLMQKNQSKETETTEEDTESVDESIDFGLITNEAISTLDFGSIS